MANRAARVDEVSLAAVKHKIRISCSMKSKQAEALGRRTMGRCASFAWG